MERSTVQILKHLDFLKVSIQISLQFSGSHAPLLAHLDQLRQGWDPSEQKDRLSVTLVEAASIKEKYASIKENILMENINLWTECMMVKAQYNLSALTKNTVWRRLWS